MKIGSAISATSEEKMKVLAFLKAELLKVTQHLKSVMIIIM